MKNIINIKVFSAVLSVILLICTFSSCTSKKTDTAWMENWGPSWGAMVDEDFLPDEFKDEVKDEPEWTVTEVGSVTCNEISGDYSYSNAIIYRSGAFCGILYNDGSVRVEPQYDNIEMLSKDYAVVEKNGLYGLITADGEALVPCEYEEVRKVNGSVKFVVFDYHKLYSLEDRKMYDFETPGRGYIYNFGTGIQLNYTSGGKDILIICNEKGEKITAAFFDGSLDESDFRNGYIRVWESESVVREKKTYYFYNGEKIYNKIHVGEKYIDFNGNALLNFETKEVFNKNGKLLFENKDSRIEFSDYYVIGNDVFVKYETYDEITEKTLYGIFDQNGNVIIENTDLSIENIGKIFYVGDYYNSYALFDCKGNQITDFVYNSVREIEEGFIAVEQGGYWGLFDPDGNALTDCVYDKISNLDPYVITDVSYCYGYLAVCMNGLWGLVDRNGVLVCPTQFEGEVDCGSVISFEDDTGPYIVNPKTGEMRRYGYIENDEDYFPEGIFWFSNSKTEGGIATYEKDLITFTGGANSSNDITEDGMVIIIGNGNTYTLYELKKG